MIDIEFDVTGSNLRELEAAAEAELLKFMPGDERSVDYSLDVGARVGTYGEHPNIEIWQARVRAQVKENR